MKSKLILLLAVAMLSTGLLQAQRHPSGSSKVTSPRMARIASSTLRDSKASKREKSLAGSTLSQSKGKKH